MSTVLSPAVEVAPTQRAGFRWQAAETAACVAVAVTSFYVAHLGAYWAWAIGVYLFAMVQLCQRGTARRAFYAGFMVGMCVAVGELTFFWRIFSAGAIALWCVYAFWLGLFTGLGRLCTLRFGTKLGLAALPLLWCGLEYFRCELYYLRFSWLSPGLAFGLEPSRGPIGLFGSYGTGLILAAIACAAVALWPSSRVRSLAVLTGALAALGTTGWIFNGVNAPARVQPLRIAGLQLEFAGEKEVLVWLNHLNQRYPEAKLLVLSEYTFDQVPPDSVKAWCREHQRYLIVGGKEPAGPGNFYNTAFVISPEGEIVFRQAKSVPIQFFKDGLPAREQKLWDSPWGKLGICICYDLSYTRVTDRLVRMGAEALIVPTMDVADWGARQHRLHARVAPTRAAEYHLPIFRLASSGISQAINSSGALVASAPFPGTGAMLYAELPLRGPGRLPFDRGFALLSVIATAVILVALGIPRRGAHLNP